MSDRSILRIGTLGAAVAVLMFVALAVLLLPFDFADPVEEILRSQLASSSKDLSHYVAILPAYFAIDSLFILGWIVGWVGIAVLARSRNKLLGEIVLVIGLVGPILDFAENEIAWALIEGYRQGMSVQVGWHLGWKIIRQLSYLIPYAAATLAAVGLWSRKPLDRVLTGVGTVFVAIAVVGLYVPAFSMLAYVWWLTWFICAGLLLWRRASEWPVE